MRRAAASLLCALAVAFGAATADGAPSTTVVLATTTSTQDSGLLDVLLPAFERSTRFSLKTIAVGTGQALALAARGEADVVLSHAPALELQYVADGKLRDRRLVMYNDFVIVGPAGDPAGVRGSSAVEAFRRIARSRSRFVSRGDRSGTHLLEQVLWRAAALEPVGAWYLESGLGMGQTLLYTNDRGAYTLTDRATLLALARRLSVSALVEGDRRLLNVYSVLQVSPPNGGRVNAAGGRAFADFLLSSGTQQMIGRFGVQRHGRPLFVPIAGAREEEL